MRANEFVIEGPGDWMQGQVIKRQQTDKANARKQNVPKIAKLLQQNLVAKAKQNGGDGPALSKLVTDTISKTLRVDADKIEGLDKLASTIASNPESIASDQVTAMLSALVTSATKSSDFTNVLDAGLVDNLKNETANMNPSETRAYIIKSLKDKEISPSLIEKYILAVTTDNEQPANADTDNPETDVDESFLDKFVDNIKEYLFRKQHSINLRDPESVADFIEFNIEKHQDQLEITSIEEADQIVDNLLKDPDMAFNFKPEKNFRGLVYSPGGVKFKQDDIDGMNTAYVQDSNDDWSEWEMQSTTSWRLKEKVVDIGELKSLESLTGEMIPKAFRQEKTGGQSNLYRVSNR